MLSAIANLVTNAVRYTPEGGQIELLWRQLEDGSCELAVVDTAKALLAPDASFHHGSPRNPGTAAHWLTMPVRDRRMSGYDTRSPLRATRRMMATPNVLSPLGTYRN